MALSTRATPFIVNAHTQDSYRIILAYDGSLLIAGKFWVRLTQGDEQGRASVTDAHAPIISRFNLRSFQSRVKADDPNALETHFGDVASVLSFRRSIHSIELVRTLLRITTR